MIERAGSGPDITLKLCVTILPGEAEDIGETEEEFLELKEKRIRSNLPILIRAHGLPLIAVTRDAVASQGRRRALLGAALLDKNDKNTKAARSAFTVGTLVAPKSFVEMPRAVDRQLFTHSGTYLDTQKDEAALTKTSFQEEFRPARNARDSLSSLHNALAVLMGDPISVIRLIDLPAYRLACRLTRHSEIWER
ncbi:unnamed protein product [Penicillium viridicatum]